jgi:hypothetical protein
MIDHSKYLLLHDTRVRGRASGFYAGLWSVSLNASTSITSAFRRINASAGAFGKLNSVFVVCHGMNGGQAWGGTSDFWWRGGGGLLLGTEQVKSSNVNLWNNIRDRVDKIVVYACGAAYKGPASWNQPTVISDGQALMADLARNTNATVYAADKIQWYQQKGLDMGRWEGQVYAFYPSGRILPFGPVTNLMDVFDF